MVVVVVALEAAQWGAAMRCANALAARTSVVGAGAN